MRVQLSQLMPAIKTRRSSSMIAQERRWRKNGDICSRMEEVADGNGGVGRGDEVG